MHDQSRPTTMPRSVDVVLRDTQGQLLASGEGFPVTDDWAIGAVQQAVETLYNTQVAPVAPGQHWRNVCLWNRIQGGHTAHVQLGHALNARGGHNVSLGPMLVAQWDEHDDDGQPV